MCEKNNVSAELLVYTGLKASLYKKLLAPGSALTERSVCDAFGVGRTPVRAAFRRLADEGFIEIIPNRGAYVVTTTQEKVSMLFDVRIDLHMLAVRKGIDRFNESDFQAMAASVQIEKQAAEQADFCAYLEQVRHFYEVIIPKAQNPVLEELYWNVYDRLQILIILYDDFYMSLHYPNSINAHLRIISALREKDPDEVERIEREHKNNVINKMNFDNIATASPEIALKSYKMEE
jgi:DNA-binding GntR family transcriptional regulator